MRKIIIVFLCLNGLCVFASNSMFDDSGNYSGNWKQMTNLNSGTSRSYNSSSYTTSNWYNSQKQARQQTGYNTQTQAVPFRYNTLDYKRIRKVKGGYGDYSSRCTDIGDASFCQ